MAAKDPREYPYLALSPDFNPTQLVKTRLAPEVLPEFWMGVQEPRQLIVRSAEEIMRHGIDAAIPTSISCLLPEGRGGPFGLAGAIPHEINPGSGTTLFADWWPTLDSPEKEELEFDQVHSWKLVVRSANLVEASQDPRDHAEGVGTNYMSRACGRNLWKRFGLIATTGAPCDMCLATINGWSRPRYVIGGAPLSEAVKAGFHEALPPELVQKILDGDWPEPDDEPWVKALRENGTYVETSVLSQQVLDELYGPYFKSGGVLYNSGPDDPTG